MCAACIFIVTLLTFWSFNANSSLPIAEDMLYVVTKLFLMSSERSHHVLLVGRSWTCRQAPQASRRCVEGSGQSEITCFSQSAFRSRYGWWNAVSAELQAIAFAISYLTGIDSHHQTNIDKYHPGYVRVAATRDYHRCMGMIWRAGTLIRRAP